jgi:hypothetical protein
VNCQRVQSLELIQVKVQSIFHLQTHFFGIELFIELGDSRMMVLDLNTNYKNWRDKCDIFVTYTF